MVANGVLEDALEQQGEFLGWRAAVFLRQLQHRFLHDVERNVLVAHREHRLLVGAPFHLSEEVRQFLAGSQLFLPYMEARVWVPEGPSLSCFPSREGSKS